MRQTSLRFLAKSKPVDGKFRAGVSLHSHTSCSCEHLRLLHSYRRHYRIMPAVLRVAERQHRRATGETLALERVFWTPPLEPARALAVETAQIVRLGLSAMVSLTDHDSIEAGLSLGGTADPRRTPVSVEWTVPFGETFFHFGLHNLPAGSAAAIFAELAAYTHRPAADTLDELLEWLNEDRGVLVVLNHPMWDEAGIGAGPHATTVRELLSMYSRRIHALEVNGLRSWAENSLTLGLATALSMAVVSGGDRHGAEPNACINLTQAGTFADFVSEVRDTGLSEVAFLPHYREPLRLRWLETARDILRFHPEAPPERRRWTGRFFYQCEDGMIRPISDVWGNAPTPWLEAAFSFVRLLGKPTLRSAMRLAFAEQPQL